MQKSHFSCLIIITLFSTFSSLNIYAQSDLGKVEVGGLVTTVNLNDSVGENPVGFGGRFTYNVTKNVAVDSEVSYFPQNPSGNFGQTIAVVGVKAGVRKEKFGVFGKVRPGVINFGGDFFEDRNNGSKSYPAIDVGGVLEYYPTSKVIIRVDVGDTIVPFGNDAINTGLSATPTQIGTTHNLQASFGVGYRF